MTFNATPNFTKWARGFAGCDGGNPEKSIWLCGIEWGFKGIVTEYDFVAEFKTDVSEPPIGYTKAEDNSHGFNQRFLKLLAVMKGMETKDYAKLQHQEPFPFHKNSDLFKINAYPLAFKSDGDELWNKKFWQATGLPTKSLYRAWCQTHRFPQIRSWVEKYSPRLIIATGSSYRTDYLLAFGGVEALYPEVPSTQKKLDGQVFEYLHINNGKTILAIVPFLGGRHGLNSDERIKRFGEELSAFIKAD